MNTFNRYDSVDQSRPYYKVDVTTEGGFPALNKVWTRGDVFLVQADSETYVSTVDSNGKSWLESNTSDYKVTYIDPDKDSKPTENLVLKVSDPDIKEVTVSDADVKEVSVKPVDNKPTKRGRPSKDDSKE